MKSNETFKKIFRVIMSCNTEEQMQVALKYLNMAAKNNYIDPMFRDAIYFNVYLPRYGLVME